MILEALAALAIQQQGTASFLNGNEVLSNCRYLTDGYPPAHCSGYLQGIADYEAALQLAGLQRMFCLPAGVTTRQLRDVVVARLEREPATRHMNGALLTVNALKEAFPCN